MEKVQDTKSVVVLATKEVKNASGGTFNVYFAYRQELVDGEYKDVMTPITTSDGKLDYISKPIKVRLSQEFEKKLKATKLSFPLLLTLDSEKHIKNQQGQQVSSYFVTVDTVKETKQPRLDKYGKKHLVLVIRDAEDIKEKPHTSYSLEDLDDFE